MSLAVVIKGPEGVVLASDSRVTLGAVREGAPPTQVNFDNATKLLSFSDPHTSVAAVTYGAAVIGLRTAHSFVPEFELSLEGKNKLPVKKFAGELSKFYLKQWQQHLPTDYDGPSMIFIVGGHDEDAPYGRVFLIDIPRDPDPTEQNPGENDFGMTWGGQLQIVSRIVQGFDPVLPSILQGELGITDEQIEKLLQTLKANLEFSFPYQVLPLQDCVDLAAFMVRTTISVQDLSIGLRGVGGPIDVAYITRTKGLQHVRRKSIKISSSSD